ncbi:ABC transporter ATP-binding protein [Methylocapsa sp. S129]|uniref:ABC transporter ATP-binding protein n=1 Tax=Methylocapsa sp. S129 TaxID=1641869 RepID=UPI00131B804B|nr:ABC transporter ATP-binding protein [Methylocapsa sp. S129]
MNQHLMADIKRTAASADKIGAIVEFDQVAKSYGAVCALQPTTFQVGAGEFFAVIGPSGSGKSTLLGIVAGFVPPTAGAIRVNGTDVVSLAPYKRNFGMVFQNYALFPHMTVAENIAFPLRMRGVSKADTAERVRRMLGMVRLANYGERRPMELSGGQQQRVALARAAVYDPLLLLMDEPLGALDKNLREEMQEEIKKFQAALGATVIYVTHDQHEAAFMADRIAIMRNGRLEQAAAPRELYERPLTPFVASFLGEATLLPVKEILSQKGEEVVVKTDSGLKICATVRSIAQAGSSICIRPENVVLGAASKCANSFSGVIEEVLYTTGSIRYRVRLADTQTLLTARIPSHPDIALLAHGERVEVGWRRQDALLVSGD